MNKKQNITNKQKQNNKQKGQKQCGTKAELKVLGQKP